MLSMVSLMKFLRTIPVIFSLFILGCEKKPPEFIGKWALDFGLVMEFLPDGKVIGSYATNQRVGKWVLLDDGRLSIVEDNVEMVCSWRLQEPVLSFSGCPLTFSFRRLK